MEENGIEIMDLDYKTYHEKSGSLMQGTIIIREKIGEPVKIFDLSSDHMIQ